MYNPLLSYEENLQHGPAAEWNRGGVFPSLMFSGRPQFSLFDFPLYLPLGMPAGPLLSASFVDVALKAGFCMPVYKTVRSRAWRSHPWPNVLRIEKIEETRTVQNPSELMQIRNPVSTGEDRASVQVRSLEQSFLKDAGNSRRLSITNAFGVPSSSPEQWSADFGKINDTYFSNGYLAVLSFQGSRTPEGRWSDFLEDTALAARLAAECVMRKGGRILEMNVSCPNEAGAPIYSDLKALGETMRFAAEGLSGFPEVKLIVKLGVVDDHQLLRTVEVIAKHAHGISSINTVSANIKTQDGKVALGSGAEHGGVCGFAIRDQALEMIHKLNEARKSVGLTKSQFALVGVGGCATVEDYFRFMEAGADVVHAATGAMWNLQFAGEVAKALKLDFSNGVTQ
jgi:dihydroorotate dehydrogenase (NAD+) catalytic subunit